MRECFYLEFDDRTGTDRSLFVTFRQHHAWAKRLKEGRLVMLCDTKARVVYGKAKVARVIKGTAWGLLCEYAVLSHLESGEAIDADFGMMEEAAKRRFAAMVRRYGPHRINHDSNMTALMLQRVN